MLRPFYVPASASVPPISDVHRKEFLIQKPIKASAVGDGSIYGLGTLPKLEDLDRVWI